MAYIPKQIQGSSVGGFTAGSVPFAAADGTLTEDNSNLFWDDANNRLGIGTSSPSVQAHITGAGSQELRIQSTSGSGLLTVSSVAGQSRDFQWMTATSRRWVARANSTAESGANAGSDFLIFAVDDSNAILGNVFNATRSTGGVLVGGAYGTGDLVLRTANTSRATFSGASALATLQDGLSIAVGTSTGTKFGTATAQKIGFFNATPVVQPADIVDITDNSGGTATTTLAAISNALSGVSCGAVGCNANHNTAAALNTELGTIRNAVATLGAQIDKIRVVMSSAAGGLGLTA